jgi:PTS system cellobiose-specific IIC component
MNIDAVVERVAPVTTKIQENLYIKTMMAGFMGTMPVLMFGAVCSLIVGFPVAAWTAWVQGTAIGAALNAGVAATTNLLAVYVVVSIGYQMGKALEKDAVASAVVALMGFVLVTPFATTAADADGNPIDVTGVLPTQWLGAQGIFTAVIVGLVASRLYCWVLDRGWKIKMPESVPPAVSKPFEAIVPGMVVGAVFLVVRGLFGLTSYGHFGQFLYTVLGKPLAGLGNSFWAWIVIALVIHVLWLLGIHGTIVAMSVLMAVLIGPATENQVAGAAGEALPYMITMTFGFAVIQWLGGPGNLFGLATNMVLFAKSDRYKTFGKLSFGPAFFNIIEPIIFGFPLVYNPLMAIPFIVTPIVNLTLGYALMSAGIIGIPWVPLPLSVFTMPFVPGGFLLGAGIGFGLFLIVAYLISVAIYFPFFKIADRQEVANERAVAAEKAARATATVRTADLSEGSPAPA